MMDYQSMVHDSTTTLFKFRDHCREAIENHVLAIDMYKDGEYLDCVEVLSANAVSKKYLSNTPSKVVYLNTIKTVFSASSTANGGGIRKIARTC